MRTIAFLLTCLALLPSPTQAVETLTIGGSGSSTLLVTAFGEAFVASPAGAGYAFVVPPKSIKHAGGLEWAASGTEVFGRTGRPLNEGDLKKFPNLKEILLAKLEVGFGVPKDLGVTKVTRAQLEGLWTGTITNWKEVGGPDQAVIRLGREPTESTVLFIAKEWPDFPKTAFDKQLKKDDEMFQSITKTPGAIGFSMRESLAAQAGIQVLQVADFQIAIASGLVYDASRETQPVVQAVKTFVASPEWQAKCVSLGFLPLNK